MSHQGYWINNMNLRTSLYLQLNRLSLEGFVGEDCSVNPSNPPLLESIRKGIKCDFRSSYCQEASIFASNFFYSEKFKCKITAVSVFSETLVSGATHKLEDAFHFK